MRFPARRYFVSQSRSSRFFLACVNFSEFGINELFSAYLIKLRVLFYKQPNIKDVILQTAKRKGVILQTAKH